jgi:hypothetical protein
MYENEHGVLMERQVTGENYSILTKTCPSTTLSITNPIWTDLGSPTRGLPQQEAGN